ncbi:MAG: DUF86 domain-containing protein [Desulfatiglandaceae bacterium]
MIDPEVITRRIEKLREYVKYLRELGERSKDRFVSDPFVYGNVERFLHLAIQSVLDIGSHIIAAKQLETPEEYQDIFRILGEQGILPEEFAKSLQPMAGLRNILVHDYLEVDREELYRIVTENLKDFEIFAKHIAKLL